MNKWENEDEQIKMDKINELLPSGDNLKAF